MTNPKPRPDPNKTDNAPPPDLPPRPPPSDLDVERSDWEGMGQGRFQPEPAHHKPAPHVEKS
jgi:hypothetical protein